MPLKQNLASMQTIVHVVNSYFAATYFIGEQFRYFHDRGYKMHLICTNSPFLEEYALKMGFILKEVNLTRRITPVQDIIAFFKILIYVRRVKPEIIVGHTVKGGLLTMGAAWLSGTPRRIYFRHGLAFETARGLGRKLLIISERIAARFSTIVVCVSNSVFYASLRYRLNSKEKQTVLGAGTCGGIDTEIRFNPESIDFAEINILKSKLKISDDDYIIGYCGRLVRDKGIEELVRAVDLIKEKRPDMRIRLLMVGMFEDRDSISKMMIDRIKNDKSIIYTGFINDKIQNYYALMNVFVLPSYREGFGMSVIEASSMQLPVLTTRVTGSIDSIIENVTGRFVENSPASIAEGVRFYLENPDIARGHGINGRIHVVENYDHSIIWREIEKLYN